MKMNKMNKAFDLNSISVFPPNLRSRDLSLKKKKNSLLAPLNQMLSSRPSSGRSLTSSKSQIGEELLEQRLRMFETSLTKFGMMLDSVHSDIIQANRGTKQVFLESERLQQKLILQDTSLQLLIKEQTDVKASLVGAVKSILEELSKDPNQEKLQKIALMLTAIPQQVETALQKIQREICHNESQVLPAIAQVPTAPPQVKAKENFPEQSGPAAKLQSSAFCNAILKTKQPQLPKNPDKTSARTVETSLFPKIQVGCWKTVKPAQRTFKNYAGRKQVKPVGTRTQFEQCSVDIDSDEEIDAGFSCLLKGNTKGAKFEWDAEKETERLLKAARRTRRKFGNPIIIN